MSLYQYNGVVIQHCRTLDFAVEPEYDPTGVDVIANKYTIRVRGFIATSTGAFPGVTDSTSSAATMALLKDQLETPRRPLTYSIAGTVLVNVTSGFGAQSLDAKLGPHPMPARVTEVTSGTFMVECGVVAHVVDCDDECSPQNPVTSLRWWQTESFDENWNSRLMTVGRLIVRSDLLQSADNFRPLCVPPLLPDYRRISSKYALSPDGLQLDFEYEDQEVDRLPPSLCTTARGTYTVVTARPGYLREGTVTIELEGPKGTDRKDLLYRAIDMGMSKLFADQFNLGPEGTGVPIMWGEFTEDLFVPRVKVSMSGMLTPLNNPAGGYQGGVLAGIFNPILNPTPPPAVMPSVGSNTYGLRSPGTPLLPPARKRLVALLTAGFRDPCLCNETEAKLTCTGIGNETGSNDDIVDLRTVPQITTGELTTINRPVGQPLLADLAPYDTYEIETTTNYNAGKIQMPGTGVGAAGGYSTVLTAGGGATTMVLNWVAGRTGKPPVLPVYDPQLPGIEPLGGAVVAQQTVPAPDGTALVFLMAGYYMYAVGAIQEVELKSVQGPQYTTLVNQGAAGGAGFWANLYAQLSAQSGTNPFDPGGFNDAGPTGSVPPVGFDLVIPSNIVGVSGFIDLGGNLNPESDPFFIGPTINP